MNTYITPIEYQRANTGQETASLIGNVGRLQGAHTAGAMALNLRIATTVDLLQDDQITLFDGGQSEVVTVGTDTPMPATTIPLASGLQFAHVSGMVYCSDGVRGSLADDIITASDMVEDTCLQSLLLTSRTDTLSLQTMQASISNDSILTLKPQNFPVQTVTGVTFSNGLITVPFDASKASIELGQQVVVFRSLVPTGNPTGSPFGARLTQRSKGTITLVYTSGFAYTSLPPRVKKACVLYTSELLSRRRNSTGATQVASGKVHTVYGVARDMSGESLLVKQAKDLLSSFIREAV